MKKALTILVRILAAAVFILILCAVIWREAAAAVFHNLAAPRADLPAQESWDGGTVYEKIPYSDVSPSDYLDLYVPSGEAGDLVVMVHGGGFVSGDSQTRQARLVYRYFRDKGYAVASVNYRLAQEAVYPEPVADVKAAVRFLRANADKYGYKADHITIMGESAGGYLASMAALTADGECSDVPFIGEEELSHPVSGQVQVLVDFYGCVELGNMEADWKSLHYPDLLIKIANSWASRDVLNGYENCESAFLGRNMSEMTPEEAYTYFPIYYAQKNLPYRDDLSIYIIHGDADITVPMMQSLRFNDMLSDILPMEKVALRIVRNAGHAADRIYFDEELERIRMFMEDGRE